MYENKNKESFSEFEIITLEKANNGKFTAETMKLTRDISGG